MSAHLLYCFVTSIPDTGPVHLLQALVPSLDHIPAGVQIDYDATSGKHAFSFTPSAAGLRLPASSVFTAATASCDYFAAEQISLLFAFKASAKTLTREEMLLALIPHDSSLEEKHIKFGIALNQNSLKVYYWDEKSRVANRFVEFADESLFDQEWHSLIVVYDKEEITVTIDCGEPRILRMQRTLSAIINIASDGFYIANSNRGKRNLFSVSMI